MKSTVSTWLRATRTSTDVGSRFITPASPATADSARSVLVTASRSRIDSNRARGSGPTSTRDRVGANALLVLSPPLTRVDTGIAMRSWSTSCPRFRW